MTAVLTLLHVRCNVQAFAQLRTATEISKVDLRVLLSIFSTSFRNMGFSPSRQHWNRFTQWAHNFIKSGAKPYVNGLPRRLGTSNLSVKVDVREKVHVEHIAPQVCERTYG